MKEIILGILSGFGIFETLYLISKRKKEEIPVCVIGKGCHQVLESKYNKIFGVVHNDVMGLLFYVGVLVMTVLILLNLGPLEIYAAILKVMVGFGVLFSCFLVFLQWRVIKAWCFWCLVSAGTVVLMAGVLFGS